MLPSKSTMLTAEARRILINASNKAKTVKDEKVRQYILSVASERVRMMCPNAFLSETDEVRISKESAERKRYEKALEYARRLTYSTNYYATTIADMANISLKDARRLRAEFTESQKAKERRKLDSLFK